MDPQDRKLISRRLGRVGWALLAYSVSAGKLRAATEEDDGLAASVAYLQWLEGDAQSAPAIFILP